MNKDILSLRKTEAADLDYVIHAEHSEENRDHIIPWPREKHLQSLSDANMAHLIVKTENPVGYVILAGLLDKNQSIEFRRIVITEKGKGYGKKAIERIKNLAFDTYNAHRLWLDVFEWNVRAQSIYEAAGFKKEGVVRECLKVNNKYESLIIMSILRQEYGQ